MNSQNKNILIGGLLAIVLVMAVGYAAFATNLNITGTANITSNWDVHFNKAACTTYDTTNGCTARSIDGDASAPVVGTKTFSGGTEPTGKLTYGDGDAPLTATVHADLNQPGDSVTFKLDIINAGSLDATAAQPTLSGDGFDIQGLTATKGHIKFTVTAPVDNPLNAGSRTTMTVKATFIDTPTCMKDGSAIEAADRTACESAQGTWTVVEDGTGTTGNTATEQSGNLTIALNYSQYTGSAQQGGN